MTTLLTRNVIGHSGDTARNPTITPLHGESATHLFMNRGKKSVVIDLKTSEGLELFLSLVDRADVVVDNFREGTLERRGISPDDDASVLDTSVEAWQRVQDVNTKGVFLCCKHGIPYLLDRGGGSVINVASFVAILGAATSQISYTASKGAVLAMSKELGVQFARQGVRVNALCPGPVETPLLLAIFGDDPAAFARRQVHWPTGRLGKPREIVNAALFLASDESSFVNGAAFVVDGGLTAAYVTPE
jgi:NAD(P)-dependent dehydrogenase (short-subunit alcohol dehydrogenase family)